jgi:hypothetical protein
MQAKIEAISVKDKYVGIKVQGTWYSIWKDKWQSTLVKGDTVDFEFTTNDKGFHNITQIKKVGGNNQSGSYDKDKQDQIRRESVLKVATDLEIHNAQQGNRKAIVDNVISMAKTFSQFVMGHDPTQEPPIPDPGDPAQDEDLPY